MSAGRKLSTVSMTGFGAAARVFAAVSLAVEIKSLNSRYLDLAVRLPREYSAFEMELRKLVAASMRRGRVELVVSRRTSPDRRGSLQFNRELFAAYRDVYLQMLGELGQSEPEASTDLALQLLQKREVVDLPLEEDAAGAEKDELFGAVREAIAALQANREREGEPMGRELLRYREELLSTAKRIGEGARQGPEVMRERLLQRVKRLAPEVVVDEARLCSEVALLADKIDVSEEITRLCAHLNELERAAHLSENGKRMDFIVQECMRELNTIGSKAQDAGIQSQVVEGKSLLEKVRELVQNLE